MTQLIETKFNFKSRTIRDEAGKEIGKSKKQPSLTTALPQPTVEEIVSILTLSEPAFAKARELILETIYNIPRDQAKQQLDEVIDSIKEDEDRTISVDDLDFDKLDLLYIANLPPAQRGARAIPEEDYEAMYQDYVAVMVRATGKPENKIVNHINHFKKPARIKTAKDILKVLIEQLDIYLVSSGNLEETGEVTQRIRAKFDRWAKEDDAFDVTAL